LIHRFHQRSSNFIIYWSLKKQETSLNGSLLDGLKQECRTVPLLPKFLMKCDNVGLRITF